MDIALLVCFVSGCVIRGRLAHLPVINAPTLPVNVTGAGSVRAMLQDETRAAHQDMHNAPLFLALLAGHISVPDYITLLQNLLAVHCNIEQSVTPFEDHPLLAWRLDYPVFKRSELLQADLRALNAAECLAVAAKHAIAPRTAYAALGGVWVVEGSQLGARVLAKRVEALLGPEWRRCGGSFFAPSAAEALRWKACCTALETGAGDKIAMAELREGALSIFETFFKRLGSGH